MSHVVRISTVTDRFTVTAVRQKLTSAIRVNLGQMRPAQTKYVAWETSRLGLDLLERNSIQVILIDRIPSPPSHVSPSRTPGVDHTGGGATRGRAASIRRAQVCRATCLIALRGTP